MRESVERSLNNLGFDYIDLVSSYLALCLHVADAEPSISCTSLKRWYTIVCPTHPFDVFALKCLSLDDDNDPKTPDGQYRIDDGITFNEVWAEMEKVLESGKVKAIGVSNFSVKNLEKLLSTAKVVPALNQVECVRSTLLDVLSELDPANTGCIRISCRRI